MRFCNKSPVAYTEFHKKYKNFADHKNAVLKVRSNVNDNTSHRRGSRKRPAYSISYYRPFSETLHFHFDAAGRKPPGSTDKTGVKSGDICNSKT